MAKIQIMHRLLPSLSAHAGGQKFSVHFEAPKIFPSDISLSRTIYQVVNMTINLRPVPAECSDACFALFPSAVLCYNAHRHSVKIIHVYEKARPEDVI